MEELKVNKDVILDAYRAGTEDQKAMLEKLYGKEIFYDFDWKEVTSYKKACELLGIRPVEILNSSDRPQYMRMANAMQQLLVICEAIYNLIDFFFNSYGVEIELLDKKEYTEQEELVNDMMMLIASFSGRLYSARAKENAKKRKENKNGI